MALNQGELARLTGERLEVRDDALRVSWRIDGVATSDQHDLVCHFECSVRPAEPVADRKMLQETFLSTRPMLGIDQVTQHFLPALRSAAAAWAKPRSGEDCLADDHRDELTAALRSAAKAVAFACGLEILPPWQMELDSPSLRRQKSDAALRSRQLERLQSTGDLLKQFESIRQSLPNLSAGKLLEQVSPSERGTMLQALLAADRDRQSDLSLWAVAGSNLVRIDRSNNFAVDLFALPQTLGPLRSVSGAEIDGNRRLLIGARGGVLLVDPQNPAEAMAFADPAIRSELGFNRAIFLTHRREIVSCHSDAGLVVWNLDSPAEPSRRFDQFGRPAGGSGARHLNPIDSPGLIFADGNRCVIGIDNPRHLDVQSPSEIVAILPRSEHSIVVHANGSIFSLDHASENFQKLSQHAGRYVTAAAVPFFEDVRILLSCEDGAIDCVGIDDTLVTRYLSNHRGVKILAADRTLIAAISADRQRLILWNTWDGQTPAQEIYLFTKTHHRIADIEFA